MAILNLGQVQLAALKEAYFPSISAVFRNNYLLPLMPPAIASQGRNSFDWKINSAGGAPEEFAENQAQPAAQTTTWVNASVTYPSFRSMLQVTGHAFDALQNQPGGPWIDQIAEDMLAAKLDILDLLTTSMLTNATYGLAASIDSTTTYAGISRGSAAYFESTETAVSAPVSVSDLLDILETIKNADKGGFGGSSNGIIIANLNQLTNIYRLTGQPFMAMGTPSDKALGLSNQSFNGIPIVPMPDLTTTEIYFIDRTPGNWAFVEHRPWDIKEMAPSGDSHFIAQVSYRALLVCKQPKMCGKLTGCTA